MRSYDATPLLLKHPANGVARWDPVLPSLLPAGGLNFIEADVFEVIRCDSTIRPHLMLINADIFEGIYRGPIAGPRGPLQFPIIHLHLSQQLTDLALGCVEHNVCASVSVLEYSALRVQHLIDVYT